MCKVKSYTVVVDHQKGVVTELAYLDEKLLSEELSLFLEYINKKSYFIYIYINLLITYRKNKNGNKRRRII